MKRLFGLLVAIAIVSCADDSNTYELKGTAAGYEDGTEIFVYRIENNQPEVIDTLTVENESFAGSYEKSDDFSLHYLRPGTNQTTILYFPENEDMKAFIYKDSISASYVSGGAQNTVYREFYNEMMKFNKQKEANIERYKQARTQQDGELVTQIQQDNLALVNEETAYKKQFLRENNNSLFAVMLISEMLNRKEITRTEAKELVENLTPKLAATQIAKDLGTMIESMKKADIGGTAPNFTAPTPDGEMLSLKETLGKYTIIDFWASWCRPCRMENPNVVRVYEKYHDKGLNIISVSLDREGQKNRWVQAIEDDNMDWYHVSNLKFWQDPIARTYNVRSIPATFLLDENGVIIDKDLRGPALEAKMESLLGGQ